MVIDHNMRNACFVLSSVIMWSKNTYLCAIAVANVDAVLYRCLAYVLFIPLFTTSLNAVNRPHNHTETLETRHA